MHGCIEKVGKEGGKEEKEQRKKERKRGTKICKEGPCCRITRLQSLLLADLGKAYTCTEREKKKSYLLLLRLQGSSHDSKKAGLLYMFFNGRKMHVSIEEEYMARLIKTRSMDGIFKL